MQHALYSGIHIEFSLAQHLLDGGNHFEFCLAQHPLGSGNHLECGLVQHSPAGITKVHEPVQYLCTW